MTERRRTSGPNDRARTEAIRNLIALHRAEFSHLLHKAKAQQAEKRTAVHQGETVC